MRNLVRIVMIAAVVAALMPPVPAYAVNYETDIVFYTGCDSTFTAVGDAYQDCSGNWTYTGTQAGDWKKITVWNCNTEMVTSRSYYHYCNGTWVVVDFTELGACDVDC